VLLLVGTADTWLHHRSRHDHTTEPRGAQLRDVRLRRSGMPQFLKDRPSVARPTWTTSGCSEPCSLARWRNGALRQLATILDRKRTVVCEARLCSAGDAEAAVTHPSAFGGGHDQKSSAERRREEITGCECKRRADFRWGRHPYLFDRDRSRVEPAGPDYHDVGGRRLGGTRKLTRPASGLPLSD